MNLDKSASHLNSRQNDSSLDVVIRSAQFTPIMQLNSDTASSSQLRPTVLHFAELPNSINPKINKKSIQLLVGSRIYQSFQCNSTPLHSDRLLSKKQQSNSLRTDQLFPASTPKDLCFESSSENKTSQVSSNSRKKSGKESIEYFSQQLNQLKENLNRLITIINHRNPEETKPSKIECIEYHPSIAVNAKQSLDAKSTESQQIKDVSICIDRQIPQFQSPQKSSQSSLQDVSPIQYRSAQLSHPSNVSDFSARSLMRRKMKNNIEFLSSSA